MKLRYLHRAYKARLRNERRELALAQAWIQRGDVVFDIGANKGAYLYWLRRFAGPGGQVVAFEPQPALAEYLGQIRAAFGWRNVRINQAALSDRPGTRRLFVPGGGISPGASLEPAGGAVELDCQTSTVDAEAGSGYVTFLKVDVEGHELAVFRGAENTISRSRPAILFECEARHLRKHCMNDVFEFLANFGYRGFLLERKLLPLDRFSVEQHQRPAGGAFWNAPDYYNNFLFCPADRAATLRRFL